MSKKNLLNESQVRQFMKLASLTPLAQGFVEGLTENPKKAEELEETHGRGIGDPGYGIDETSPGRRVRVAEGDDELDPELHATEDELGAEDHIADEEGDELDALEAPAPEEDGADQMISVQDLMVAITAALEDVTGQPVESEIEDGPAEDEVEMDVELGAPDDAAASMEADTEMEMDSEPLEEDDDKNEPADATDELVEQITKRVAARILKSALAKK
jgi:hypothetical protein